MNVFLTSAWPAPRSFACINCGASVEPDANAYRGWRHAETKSALCRRADLRAEALRRVEPRAG